VKGAANHAVPEPLIRISRSHHVSWELPMTWPDKEIKFIFVPSVGEISSYTGDNSYYCGLENLPVSICELRNAAIADFQKKDSSDPHFGNPRFHRNDFNEPKSHGYFPELMFSTIVTLLSGGMGLAVYRLLNLWIKAKNGRKIHVRLPNGLVVDATQMSHEEFSAFLAEVYAVYTTFEDAKRLQNHIKDKHVPVVSDLEARQIETELTDAV
jgi:hypothetical protein